MAGDSKLLVRFGCDSDTTGQPGGPGIGVKICAADHKLLETQSMPPTLHGGAAGCEGGILTPMLGPPWVRLSPGVWPFPGDCAAGVGHASACQASEARPSERRSDVTPC